ncbi:MAG: hypothetical protein ABSC51_11020 [Gaiellaceae bacterium]
MGGTAAVLRIRLALAAASLALLALYLPVSQLLPDLPAYGDVIWVDFVLSALMFAPAYLALGLRNRLSAVVVAAASVLLAVALYSSGFKLAASLPKLAAATLIGFIFLRLFPNLWILVAVVLIAPVTDTVSVWRGPTHQILTTAPQVFDAFAIASPIPGERVITLRWDSPGVKGVAGYLVFRRGDGGRERLLTTKPFCTASERCGAKITFANVAQPAAADAIYRIVSVDANGKTGQAKLIVPPAGKGRTRIASVSGALAPRNPSAETAPDTAGLGVSDVIFFALFLAGATRFGLRPRATWAALVVSLGVTSILADYGDFFHLNGFPAIPGLSLAFLLVNGDLIWTRLRRREEVDLDYEPRPVPLPRR